jgi:hypothetical protein
VVIELGKDRAVIDARVLQINVAKSGVLKRCEGQQYVVSLLLCSRLAVVKNHFSFGGGTRPKGIRAVPSRRPPRSWESVSAMSNEP